MSAEVLHIGLRESRGTRVLRLTGELDAYSSDRLARVADTWLNGAKRLVINLDGLQYVDSTGLSTLVWMWVEARERKVDMVISCHNPRIHRVLEITGLLKLFTLEAAKPEVVTMPDMGYTPPMTAPPAKPASKAKPQFRTGT